MRGLLALGLAVGAHAQPTSLRQDSIPPLPDSLRLYGGTLATRRRRVRGRHRPRRGPQQQT